GFRFRDFADFQSATPGQAIDAMDQYLGKGDGEARAFQLVKYYGDAARVIAKPVEGSVIVALSGVALAPEAFAVEPTTGVVTLNVAPAEGAVVTAGFQFDTPVRFDSDRMEVTLESFQAG